MMAYGRDPRFGSAILALSILICCVALFAGKVVAIDAKCSACYSIGAELSAVMKAETPKNHLDMRNRLNSKGVREGKVIDYKISELRTTEILDDLCERVKYYMYNTTAREWMKVPSKEERRRRYGDAVAEQRSKEIRNYCVTVIEEHEDAIASAIREGHFDEVEASFELCHVIVRHCKSLQKAIEKQKKKEALEAGLSKLSATSRDAGEL